ncbi:hypothetical protein SCHPADRAFT_998361 [Schizopora paradoxa]|uniref:Uncharacterized protein n=1 Tax=Schizopora paradoxa TaxID=27342 RepID=A0A0H2RRM4_9AGAM|nr:hypothetical protein SCHPADRAFT_998361 [Schizopora paradoxa]
MPQNQDAEPTPSDAFSSTAHSTTTAPNLVGPGRTLGLFLDWMGNRLESLLNNRAAQLNMGPEAIAADIRRIRRHEEMSISTRYAVPYAYLTKSQEKKVHKLCKSLLKHARSHVRSTQLKALEEITTLAVEDRVVRNALLNCDVGRLVPNYKEPDLSVAILKAISCVENREIHELWSPMFALVEHISLGGDLSIRREDVESLLGSLKKSLSNTESSFLAARYLLRVVHHGSYLRNLFPGEFLLHELWAYYLDLSTVSPEAVEWTNVNDCGSIMCKGDDRFYRKDVVECLIEKSTNLRIFFALALDVTMIEFCSKNPLTDMAEPFTFTQVLFLRAKSSGFRNAKNSFAIPNFAFSSFRHFLKSLTDSEAYLSHLTFLRGQEPEIQKKLKDIFIGNEVLIIFRRIADHIIEANGMPYVSCQCLSLGEGSALSRNSDCPIDCPMRAITILSSYQSFGNTEDRALAAFLISVIFSTNRYYKLALCNASKGPLCFSQRTLSCASSLVPWHNNFGFKYQSMFRGILWRIRMKGKYYFIPSFKIPKCSYDVAAATKGLPNRHGDIDRIDATLLRDDIIKLLPVNEKAPFDATGHFPITAFLDDSNAPLYVSIVTKDDGTEIFATVKDGDPYAAYHDERGEVQRHLIFRVLVLRHDPVDFPHKEIEKDCFIPRTGALDPTGPVYWLQYFPKKDMEFFEDVEEYLPQDIKDSITSREVGIPAMKDEFQKDFEITSEGGSTEIQERHIEGYRSGDSDQSKRYPQNAYHSQATRAIPSSHFQGEMKENRALDTQSGHSEESGGHFESVLEEFDPISRIKTLEKKLSRAQEAIAERDIEIGKLQSLITMETSI